MKLVKDQIACQFSRAASTYDFAAQLQNEMAERLFDALPAAASGRLVDLGCGTGWALDKLAQTKRFELTAIDIASGMIKVARERVPTADFHCCDLEETPLDDNVADIVFSNAAVQWCDLDGAIKEMRRICKPQGSLVFSTFGPGTLNEIRTAWQSVGDQTDRVHEFESCSSVESTMKQACFEQVVVASVERKLTFDSVDALLKNIKQLGATNASASRQTGLMGTKRYQTFRDVFQRRLARNGHLELTFECIFVVAKKG